jgi:hypothetical protein
LKTETFPYSLYEGVSWCWCFECILLGGIEEKIELIVDV